MQSRIPSIALLECAVAALIATPPTNRVGMQVY